MSLRREVKRIIAWITCPEIPSQLDEILREIERLNPGLHEELQELECRFRKDRGIIIDKIWAFYNIKVSYNEPIATTRHEVTSAIRVFHGEFHD